MAKLNEHQHQAFLYWLGTLYLKRERDGGQVNIDDDHELLEEAFRSGWEWGARCGEPPQGFTTRHFQCEYPPEEER